MPLYFLLDYMCILQLHFMLTHRNYLFCVSHRVYIHFVLNTKGNCPIFYYSWVHSLIWLGYKQELKQDDLYATPEGIRSQLLLEKFNKLVINYSKFPDGVYMTLTRHSHRSYSLFSQLSIMQCTTSSSRDL